MNDLTVKYKNELNTIPMRKLNSVEMDLFFSICAKMKNEGTKALEFSFSELKILSAYKPTAVKRFADDLDNTFDKLLNLKYRTNSDGVRKRFVLFPDYEIDENNQVVTITINPKLEYILNQLSSEFTQFELKEFTELSSSYSKTMYRLLKQYKSTGFYTVKVLEFRELLDIPSSYKTMSKLDEKVLKPIKKELSEYFDPFEIKKVKAKKGNKIERLEFVFIEKIRETNISSPKITVHDWVN